MRTRAPKKAAPSRRHAALALAGASIAGVFVAAAPTPSLAHAREARAPSRASPVERAITGGLVTLRAPGARMIRVARSDFVMGSSIDDVLAALARCASEPLGHRCTERTFSNELPKLTASVDSFWLDRT